MTTSSRHLNLPNYPPDSAEELIDYLQDRLRPYVRGLAAPEAGSIHNHFALVRQTLKEMDFQQRRQGRVFSILKEVPRG